MIYILPSTPTAQKRFQAKYVMPAFNSKKPAAVFRVHQTTLDLVISRCRFAEEAKKYTKSYIARANAKSCNALFLF